MQVLAIDFESGFQTAFENGIALLPKIGYFLLILIIGIFLAKFVQKILEKVLQKVGFDRLVERGGIKQALSKSKYDAASILARIVYYFIFLFVLSAAFAVFGPNPISQFLQQIIFFLPKLFVAIVALIIAAAVAAAVKELLSNMLGGLSFGNVLANLASAFIIGIGVFFALDQLEIAPLIVGGIFYALLALVIIPPIIAFGVGGIEPARDAIRNMQSKAQSTAHDAKQQMQSSSHGDEHEGADERSAPPAPAPVRRSRSAGSTTATTVAGAPAAPVRRRRPTA
jgi:hypothetical protein